MAGYGDALTYVRDQLAGAGVAAVLDTRDLNLPGAWVEPNTLTPAYLDGGMDASVTVVLVVPDSGPVESLNMLTDLLTLVLEGTSLQVPEVEATRARLENHSPDPLPALRFTTTVQLTT